MQVAPVVQPTWWQTFVASLYGILGMILRGLVKLIGFLLIIVIGWFVSSLVAKAIVAVLRTIPNSLIAWGWAASPEEWARRPMHRSLSPTS